MRGVSKKRNVGGGVEIRQPIRRFFNFQNAAKRGTPCRIFRIEILPDLIPTNKKKIQSVIKLIFHNK